METIEMVRKVAELLNLIIHDEGDGFWSIRLPDSNGDEDGPHHFFSDYIDEVALCHFATYVRVEMVKHGWCVSISYNNLNVYVTKKSSSIHDPIEIQPCEFVLNPVSEAEAVLCSCIRALINERLE